MPILLEPSKSGLNLSIADAIHKFEVRLERVELIGS